MAPGFRSHPSVTCSAGCTAADVQLEVRTQSNSGTSSHTTVGALTPGKPGRQLLLLCDTHIRRGRGQWLLLQSPVQKGGGCPTAAAAIPAPSSPLVVAEAVSRIPSMEAVFPLFPWQHTVQTSSFSPRKLSSIGLHCWKSLIQFWEIPTAPLYWAEATSSYDPLSSRLPRNSSPYKSHLAFQHGVLLTETTILNMLQ